MVDVFQRMNALGEVTEALARHIKGLNTVLATGYAAPHILDTAVGDGAFNRASYTRVAEDGVKLGKDIRLSTMPHHRGLWALFGCVHDPLMKMATYLPGELGKKGFVFRVHTGSEVRHIPLHMMGLEQDGATSSILGHVKRAPDSRQDEARMALMQKDSLAPGIRILDPQGKIVVTNPTARLLLWGHFSTLGMGTLRNSDDPYARQKLHDRQIYGLDDMQTARERLVMLLRDLAGRHGFDAVPLFDRLVHRNQTEIQKRFREILIPELQELIVAETENLFQFKGSTQPDKVCFTQFKKLCWRYSRESFTEILNGFYNVDGSRGPIADIQAYEGFVLAMRAALISQVKHNVLEDIRSALGLPDDIRTLRQSPRLKEVLSHLYPSIFQANKLGQDIATTMQTAAAIYIQSILGRDRAAHAQRFIPEFYSGLIAEIATAFRPEGEAVVAKKFYDNTDETRPDDFFTTLHNIYFHFGNAADEVHTPKAFATFLQLYQEPKRASSDAKDKKSGKNRIIAKRSINWLEREKHAIIGSLQNVPDMQESIARSYNKGLISYLRKRLHTKEPG